MPRAPKVVVGRKLELAPRFSTTNQQKPAKPRSARPFTAPLQRLRTHPPPPTPEYALSPHLPQEAADQPEISHPSPEIEPPKGSEIEFDVADEFSTPRESAGPSTSRSTSHKDWFLSMYHSPLPKPFQTGPTFVEEETAQPEEDEPVYRRDVYVAYNL